MLHAIIPVIATALAEMMFQVPAADHAASAQARTRASSAPGSVSTRHGVMHCAVSWWRRLCCVCVCVSVCVCVCVCVCGLLCAVAAATAPVSASNAGGNEASGDPASASLASGPKMRSCRRKMAAARAWHSRAASGVSGLKCECRICLLLLLLLLLLL